mmetsp:Transcript_14855/g.34927  ORF Transcript_14855/g.34927 Transcript_14855/m.34927 type:complete len:213 (-) Transcript_14855:171-809(-)
MWLFLRWRESCADSRFLTNRRCFFNSFSSSGDSVDGSRASRSPDSSRSFCAANVAALLLRAMCPRSPACDGSAFTCATNLRLRSFWMTGVETTALGGVIVDTDLGPGMRSSAFFPPFAFEATVAGVFGSSLDTLAHCIHESVAPSCGFVASPLSVSKALSPPPPTSIKNALLLIGASGTSVLHICCKNPSSPSPASDGLELSGGVAVSWTPP